MNRGIAIVIAVILVVAGLAGIGAFFTVDETEQALVIRFGDPRRAVTTPGLNIKVPFVDDVVLLEKRILDFDAPPEEIITSDKKRLVVDAYARFKIKDPLKFYQAVNNEDRARARLANIVNSNLRKTLGTAEFLSVLSGERAKLMREIRSSVNTEAAKLGLEIVDVRIKRADLPDANSQAVFRRMQAEREREAKEYRAQGDEQSQKIRADADRQRTVLLAEARKTAEILRGQGDAVRNRIFAEAYKSDPEFFAFYRSLQAYAKAMTSNDTTLVLSPDSEFFRYFTNQFGQGNKVGVAKGKKSE